MLGRLARLASPLGQQVGKFLAKMIRDVADYQAEDRKYCWKGRFSSRCWLIFSKDGDEYNLGQDRNQHWWMNINDDGLQDGHYVYDDPESLFLCVKHQVRHHGHHPASMDGAAGGVFEQCCGKCLPQWDHLLSLIAKYLFKHLFMSIQLHN